MANLQIKGIEEDIYAHIKQVAAAENRSVSQQILFLVKKYMAGSGKYSEKTAAQTLLELSGSWDDDRPAEAIISEIKKGRKNRKRRSEGIF